MGKVISVTEFLNPSKKDEGDFIDKWDGAMIGAGIGAGIGLLLAYDRKANLIIGFAAGGVIGGLLTKYFVHRGLGKRK